MALLSFLQIVLTVVIIATAFVIGLFVWKNSNSMYKQIWLTLIVIGACVTEILVMHLLGGVVA